MADAKSLYSTMATQYVDANTGNAKPQYNSSKERENRYNENWLKQKVNLNKIINRFAPNAEGEQNGGVKFIFRGDRYNVVVDMASGYLRIYDKLLCQYVKLDGTVGTPKETHYKIKRREEMKIMYFSLIKDISHLSMYGDIPEVTGASSEEAETYYGTFDDGLALRDHFLPAMYENIKDCLLDLSDVDYYDATKCVIIKKIIDEKLKASCEPRLRELYTVLYGYVNRAIELGTGVVIEL